MANGGTTGPTRPGARSSTRIPVLSSLWENLSGQTRYDPRVGFISGDPDIVYPGGEQDFAAIEQARGGFYDDRGTENQLIQDLQLAAAGQGPSVAQAQLEQGLEQSQAQQMAMARSAQGGAAQRNAALSQAAMNAATQAQETSREAGIQRAQEQIAAREALGGQLTSRQQAAMNQQELALQQAEANQRAQLEAERIRTETARSNAQGRGGPISGALGAIGGALMMSDVMAKEDVAPIQRRAGQGIVDFARGFNSTPQQAGERIGAALAARRQRFDQQDAARAAAASSVPQQSGGGLGALIGGALSDIRAKEDVDALDSAERRALSFRDVDVDYPELATPDGNRRGLAPVDPYRYRYTEDAASLMGTDRDMRTGVMAQDLERSPYLRDAVVDTPAGKAIDEERALSGSLAAAAGLDKRLQGQEEESVDLETRISDLEEALSAYERAKERGASDEELRLGRF